MQNWQILVLKNLSPLPTQAQEYSSREVVRPVFDFVAACLEIIAATSCRVPRILCDRRKKLRSCSAEGRVRPLCNTVLNRNMEIRKQRNTMKHRNTAKHSWPHWATLQCLQYWNTTLLILKHCNTELKFSSHWTELLQQSLARVRLARALMRFCRGCQRICGARVLGEPPPLPSTLFLSRKYWC